MDAFLHHTLQQLIDSGQRVVVYYKFTTSDTIFSETGVVKKFSGTSVLLKGRESNYYHSHIPLEGIRKIVSSTKSRSKRDLAKYGEYRVFYEHAPVRLNETGELDLASTMRALLAVA